MPDDAAATTHNNGDGERERTIAAVRAFYRERRATAWPLSRTRLLTPPLSLLTVADDGNLIYRLARPEAYAALRESLGLAPEASRPPPIRLYRLVTALCAATGALSALFAGAYGYAGWLYERASLGRRPSRADWDLAEALLDGLGWATLVFSIALLAMLLLWARRVGFKVAVSKQPRWLTGLWVTGLGIAFAAWLLGGWFLFRAPNSLSDQQWGSAIRAISLGSYLASLSLLAIAVRRAQTRHSPPPRWRAGLVSRRVLALLIDTSFAIVLIAPLLALTGSASGLFATVVAYRTAVHGGWGSTFGKRLLGIHVVRGAERPRPPTWAQAFLREGPYWALSLSYVGIAASGGDSETLWFVAALTIGFSLVDIAVGFRGDDDSRAIHDLFAGTRVEFRKPTEHPAPNRGW